MEDGLRKQDGSPSLEENSPRSSFSDEEQLESQPLAQPATAQKPPTKRTTLYARDILAFCFLVLCAISASYISLGRSLPNLIFWKTSHGSLPERLGIILSPEKHTLRDAHSIPLQWHINTGFREPDGVKKRVYLVNGDNPISHKLLLSVSDADRN